RLVHRQGHLRHRRLRSRVGGSRAGQHHAQPRPVRRHFRARGAGLRYRSGRGVSLALRRRRQTPASLDARRLAAAALAAAASHGPPYGAGHWPGQDTGQPEAFAAGAAHPGDPGPGLGAAAAVGRQGHVAGAGRNGHPRLPAGALRLAVLQTFFSLAFLADQAWRMADAILRTLVRLLVTRRHLLEWTTAAQSAQSPRLDVRGFYRQMDRGTGLGLAMAGGAMAFA